MLLALDNGNTRDALHRAMELLSELRTSLLSPQNYYDLYMQATEVLHRLEAYIVEEDSRGGLSVMDLYEQVQHSGNIIPRLYLLATVGSAYIKSKKAPCKDILFDLVELCRGVQHPMRGLFLRNYLSRITRDKLPDKGSIYEGDGGDVKDAIEFVLQNFGEMNKLWVRMQHQGALRDIEKREEERRNLKQLVGTGVVRLSDMDGVDAKIYSQVVLPKLLEVTINCKDVIAQEYLMECIIQVFPDEFHLLTLEDFLKSIQHLKSKVNVNSILVSMMNRLSNFAKESPEKIPKEIDTFALFHVHSDNIIKSKTKMTLEQILSLQAALLNYSSKCYPEKLDNADLVLQSTTALLSRSDVPKELDPACIKLVKSLLLAPLETMKLNVLTLKFYKKLLKMLGLNDRRDLAIKLMETVLATNEPLDTPKKVKTMMIFIEPCLRDSKDSKIKTSETDKVKFVKEQEMVAKLFHQIYVEDTDIQLKIYELMRKFFGQGGVRIKYTIPPLVFGCLNLVDRMKEQKASESKMESTPSDVFRFLMEILDSDFTNTYPALAIRLLLKCATYAGQIKLEDYTYSLMALAFTTYEEEIVDNKSQLSILLLIISSLESMSGFTDEEWENLSSKCAKYSAKLLKKEDQTRALGHCAHLFWPTTPQNGENKSLRDPDNVLKCIQRGLKSANKCKKTKVQVELFIFMLNKFLFFFQRGVSTIDEKFIQGIILLIEESLYSLEGTPEDDAIKKYYVNTIKYIRSKKTEDSPFVTFDLDQITSV